MVTTPPAISALEQQHRRLENIFAFIARGAREGNADESDAVWDVAVDALERHMAEEEQQFAPLDALTPAQAEIIGALRSDHARMRACLAELGVTVQLRCASPATLADLVEAVHTHASREETTYYRWLGAPVTPIEEPAPASAAFVASTLGACLGAVGGMVMSPLGMVCGAVLGATLGRAAGEALDGGGEQACGPSPKSGLVGSP